MLEHAGLILPPKHAVPTLITREGMLSAALDTASKSLNAGEIANIVVGYSFSGKMTFFCDFDELVSSGDVKDKWKELAAAGTDLWFSLLYAPFVFDGNDDVIKLQKIYAVAILVGTPDGEGTSGSIYLIRNEGLTRLPAKLAGFLNGNPQFTFDYNDKAH